MSRFFGITLKHLKTLKENPEKMVQIIFILYLNYQCMSFAFDDHDEKREVQVEKWKNCTNFFKLSSCVVKKSWTKTDHALLSF